MPLAGLSSAYERERAQAADSAREEIRDIVNDIIAIKNFAMTISEQEELLEDICNDVLGYGPLEPLLARAPELASEGVLERLVEPERVGMGASRRPSKRRGA